MVLKIKKEEFEERVKQGLRVSHGLNLDPFPDDIMPNAPVAFLMVTDKHTIAADYNDTSETLSFPMMIPLPMKKVFFESDGDPNRNSLSVRFKITFTVRFIKPDCFCHFFLALCLPPNGTLIKVRIRKPKSTDPDLKYDCSSEPMFDDVYFIESKKVVGGANVLTDVYYLSSFYQKDYSDGPFSFSIRLGFPFLHVYGFRGEQDEETSATTRKCKIRLNLHAKDHQVVSDFSVNYPLKVITNEEDLIALVQESEGHNVQWPDQDLSCTYTSVAPG